MVSHSGEAQSRSAASEKKTQDVLERYVFSLDYLAVLIQEELEEGLDNDWLLLLREVIFTTLFMLRFQKFCREIKKPFICTWFHLQLFQLQESLLKKAQHRNTEVNLLYRKTIKLRRGKTEQTQRKACRDFRCYREHRDQTEDWSRKPV